MEDYIEIKVKDLQEGQRFWNYSTNVGRTDVGKVVVNGKCKIPEDGNGVFDLPSPHDTVYIKSIINTGDTMSKQDELKQLEKEIAGHRNAQGTLDGCITAKRKQIEGIKKQIAEAEKPNMKLGDMFYGSNSGKPVLMTGSAPDGRGVYEDGARAPMGRQKYSTVTPTFNAFDAFDDLKALQEDVPLYVNFPFKTSVSGSHYIAIVQLKSDAAWIWSSDGKGIKLEGKELSGLILKLQQAEATLKRNNK